MSLSPTRRRADDFARLLDSGARTDDPVTAPLLALSAALGALPPAAGPRPEFRDALRRRVVAMATVQGVPEPESASSRLRAASSTWRVQRRVGAIAAGAAVVTAVAGVGISASRSLPGDPFYSVKRASEDVQLATTTGTEGRGKRHLEFARTRLDEVKSIVGQPSSLGPAGGQRVLAAGPAPLEGTASLVASALGDMDAETRQGADDLVRAFQSSGEREPLESLDRFTRTQYADLRGLLPALPASVQARAAQSLALLQAVATRTVTLAAAPAGSGSTPAPTPARTFAPARPTHTPGGGRTSSTPTVAPSTPASGATSGPGGPVPAPGPVVPTIPSVPLPVPLPSSGPPSLLPTSLPTLPPLSGLLGH